MQATCKRHVAKKRHSAAYTLLWNLSFLGLDKRPEVVGVGY